MIAYVFWHWRKPDSPRADYETRQQRFHAALEGAPPRGFFRSFSVGLAGVPWASAGADAYEDWYLVEDFAALGSLNEAAVTGSRRGPHDAAATAAAGGAAGVYSLRLGEPIAAAVHAQWFDKPGGMAYAECFSLLGPLVDEARGALWVRQMSLGPAREFCIHAGHPVPLPPAFAVLTVPLRQVWPAAL